MRRLLRSLLRLLILLIVLAGGLYIAARVYLNSESTRQQVASRLKDMYGGPVKLQDAEIGVLGGTTLHDLRLYQTNNGDSDPWLTIGTVETDVSAIDLLRGVLPKKITLRDPALTLHLDRSGRLLTQLPESAGVQAGAAAGGGLPDVRIQGGTVTIQQDGRPPLVVRGVQLAIQPENARITARGTVSDATWGDWALDGSLDPADGSLTATLKTDQTALTSDKLRSLPFVPERVWQEVKATGTTAARVTLRDDPKSRTATHYRVVLQPQGSSVTLPALDLHLDDVHGGITIEDGLVTLEGVTSKALAGTIETNESTLDFRRPENRFHVDLTARDVVPGQLPRHWDLPAWIPEQPGRLGCRADLHLRSDGTKVTGGTGEAIVSGVQLGGEATSVRLRLRPGPQRFGLGDAAIDATKPPKESRRPRAEPPASTSVEITLDVKNAALAQLVKDLRIALPFDVAGRVEAHLQVSLPVDRAGDLQAYRASGIIALPTLTLFGLELETVGTRIAYEEGVLRLENVQSWVAGAPGSPPHPAPAHLAGSARLHLVPQGDMVADLTLTAVPLEPVVRQANLSQPIAGAVSGKVEVRVPVAQLRDPAAWHGSGTINVERIAACGWALIGAGAALQVADGKLTVSHVAGTLEGAALTGAGTLSLAAPYRYAGRLELARGDLASLQRLAPELRPPVAVTGQFGITSQVNGTLGPFTAHLSGSAGGRGLTIEKCPLQSLQLRWVLADQALRLTEIQAVLPGGTVTGTATVPLDAEHDAEANLASPRLRIGNWPLDQLTARLAYRTGRGEYHLRGGVLGGTFDVDGLLPSAVTAAGPAAPLDSHLQLRGVQLGRLGPALNKGEALNPLHGRVDLDLDYRLSTADHWPTGSGRFGLTRLGWGDRDGGDGVRGTLRLADDELHLRDLSGALAGGTVRGQVTLHLREPNRSHLSLAVEGADAGRMLAPWPALAANVTGTLDARIHATLGRQWQGSGDLILTHGKIAGIEVPELRLPLRCELAPALSRARFDSDELSAQVAHGRVTGQVHLGLNSDTRLEGNLRFQEINVRALSRPLAESSRLNSGQMSGEIAFSGSNVRSPDDLNATVQAAFTQSQPFQLPILSQLVPFVVPGRADTTVQAGEVRGRLAGGIFRLQRLTLSGGAVDLYADGTLTTAGRLNLEVIATTGLIGATGRLLRPLGVRLPPNGPLPLTLLLETARQLASTSVHLRVNGTARHPTVRVQPLSLLSDEAARFFLIRASTSR